MKFAIIAGVALLLLLGGGAGAYFYFNKPAEAAASAEAGKNHDDSKQAKKEEKGEHGEKAKVAFYEMDPLLLPIVDHDGVNQVISLVVAIEVPDEATAEEVKALSPRLKDAFIQSLYGELNEQMAMKGGAVQVAVIKSRLKDISVKLLGKEMVNDVLLQVVQQRPA